MNTDDDTPSVYIYNYFFITAAADETNTITNAMATAITVCSTLLMGIGFCVGSTTVLFSGSTVSNVDSSMV